MTTPLLSNILLLLTFTLPVQQSAAFSSWTRWTGWPTVERHHLEQPLFHRIHGQQSTSVLFSSSSSQSTEIESLKQELLNRIEHLREEQLLAGDFSVDFGVKGGELNETSRAPSKLDFYSISESVGKAADAVEEICQQLALLNPTACPTEFLGDKEKGDQSPLEGPWKLLHTTAADATFSKNSTRGEAKAQNIVDGKRGRITNVIDFQPSSRGEMPFLKQLNVAIKAKAVSAKRVQLTFQYAKAVFSRFLFIPIQWSLYIPVPATFITRVIVLFNRILRRKKAVMPPKAYFDVLYLDKDLRIHQTGEDNLFVQARDTWLAAKYLLL